MGHFLHGSGCSSYSAGRATLADGSDCAFIVAGGDGGGSKDGRWYTRSKADPQHI